MRHERQQRDAGRQADERVQSRLERDEMRRIGPRIRDGARHARARERAWGMASRACGTTRCPSGPESSDVEGAGAGAGRRPRAAGSAYVRASEETWAPHGQQVERDHGVQAVSGLALLDPSAPAWPTRRRLLGPPAASGCGRSHAQLLQAGRCATTSSEPGERRRCMFRTPRRSRPQIIRSARRRTSEAACDVATSASSFS